MKVVVSYVWVSSPPLYLFIYLFGYPTCLAVAGTIRATLANLIGLLTIHNVSVTMSRPTPASTWLKVQVYAQKAQKLSSQDTPASLFSDTPDLSKYYSSFKDLPATLKRAGVPSGFDTLITQSVVENPNFLTRISMLAAQARSLAVVSLIFPALTLLSIIPAFLSLHTNIPLLLTMLFLAVVLSGWSYKTLAPTPESVLDIVKNSNMQLYDTVSYKLLSVAILFGIWLVLLSSSIILGGT